MLGCSLLSYLQTKDLKKKQKKKFGLGGVFLGKSTLILNLSNLYSLYELFKTFKFVTSDTECHFRFHVNFNVPHLNLSACVNVSVLGLSPIANLARTNLEAK